jgi:branched-chain amino acid transport system substrate-binding protein
MAPFATRAFAAAALAALLAVAAQAAAAPGARPLGRSSCGPMENPSGKHLIASDLPLRGAARAQTLEMSKAIAFVLQQHEWRAGRYTLAYQSCDDSTAAAEMWDARKCAGNARAYARNRDVIGVIGTFNSGCAEVALPILNQARDGAIAMVSPANTSIGLTHRGPGTEPDEPRRYYPTGKRNYARVIAPDDAQAAADAILTRQLGVKTVFVLHDGGAYGIGVGTAFRNAGTRLGLTVAGFEAWDPSGSSYDSLARRIKAAQVQGVFLGGLVCANGSKLVKDLRARLGANVRIIAADGFTPISALTAAAGNAAEGVMISVAGRPNEKLPPAGRRFVAAFTKANGGKAPDPFAVHAAQATEALVAAIAASDGTRGNVAARLLGVKIRNGILGTFGFDRNGDATASAVAIYRIRDGKGWQETVIVPPAALIRTG